MFQNAMGSKMKDMISDVDHGHRVTALESGFTGLEDSMGQHRNYFDSKMVGVMIEKVLNEIHQNISYHDIL